ncbi:MAG: TetR/AcrR family transcriptional regulator [Actinomycetota bacterium]|nr:TetR/AcrR family transcriptional regulator [Actinomycetota bacterium]
MTPGTAEWWRARLEDAARDPAVPAAALHLLDDGGPDALSMRRLAAALGTTARSLYRDVGRRDEVVAEVVDHVLGEVRLDHAVVGWRQGAESHARELRRVLGDHPAVVPLLADDPLGGPNATAWREHGVGLLRDAGARPELAGHGHLVLCRFVIGCAPTDGEVADGADRDEVFDLGLTSLLDGLGARLPRPHLD